MGGVSDPESTRAQHEEPNRETDPAGDAERHDQDATTRIVDGMSAAAKRSGLDRVVEEGASPRALLVAMGGVRGILEAVLPGVAFLVLYTVTTLLSPETATVNLWVSALVPVGITLIAMLVRFLQKSQVAPALGGLIGLVISAFLALRSGEGRSYYELGFWTNGAYGVGILITVLIGWPLVGLIAGALKGDGVAWKKRRRDFLAFQWITVIWVAFFALRLLVQVPLYLMDNVVALGVTRLVMGPPLYGVMLVLTFLYVRAMYARRRADTPDAETSES